MEAEGWNVDYEVNIGWGIVDVLARKEGWEIAVECGPCRLSKIINYFRISTLNELWIVSYYSNDRSIFIIKRGENWNEKTKEADNSLEREIRKIKSPLDSINQ